MYLWPNRFSEQWSIVHIVIIGNCVEFKICDFRINQRFQIDVFWQQQCPLNLTHIFSGSHLNGDRFIFECDVHKIRQRPSNWAVYHKLKIIDETRRRRKPTDIPKLSIYWYVYACANVRKNAYIREREREHMAERQYTKHCTHQNMYTQEKKITDIVKQNSIRQQAWTQTKHQTTACFACV